MCCTVVMYYKFVFSSKKKNHCLWAQFVGHVYTIDYTYYNYNIHNQWLNLLNK